MAIAGGFLILFVHGGGGWDARCSEKAPRMGGAEQLHKFSEVRGSEIGDRPVCHTVFIPADYIVAVGRAQNRFRGFHFFW